MLAEDEKGIGLGPSPTAPRWLGGEGVWCPPPPPPQPLVPPWPPRRQGKVRGSAPGCYPPLPLLGRVIGGLLPPQPSFPDPAPPGSARLAWLGVWRFAGVEALGPRAGEGQVPSTLGGAVHRRAAGGSESGRAWDAGRARPSQEDSEAAPARGASGMSTWRPGATGGGGGFGAAWVPEEHAWPSWPARQQPLMPQPRLLHKALDGAPCSKQSALCAPLPTPGGRLRCGAASGTLRAGARGGRRAYGSRGGAPSRGRGKQSMRKRSLCCGRMRAGARMSRADESRQCAARRISWA